MCCLCPKHSGGRCFWSQTIDSHYNVDTTFKGSFNKVPLEMCRFDNPIQHYTYLEFPYLHREQNWKWAFACCLHNFTLQQCLGKVSSRSSLFKFFLHLCSSTAIGSAQDLQQWQKQFVFSVKLKNFFNFWLTSRPLGRTNNPQVYSHSVWLCWTLSDLIILWKSFKKQQGVLVFFQKSILDPWKEVFVLFCSFSCFLRKQHVKYTSVAKSTRPVYQLIIINFINSALIIDLL